MCQCTRTVLRLTRLCHQQIDPAAWSWSYNDATTLEGCRPTTIRSGSKLHRNHNVSAADDQFGGSPKEWCTDVQEAWYEFPMLRQKGCPVPGVITSNSKLRENMRCLRLGIRQLEASYVGLGHFWSLTVAFFHADKLKLNRVSRHWRGTCYSFDLVDGWHRDCKLYPCGILYGRQIRTAMWIGVCRLLYVGMNS